MLMILILLGAFVMGNVLYRSVRDEREEGDVVGVALRHVLPGGHIVCYVRRMTSGIQSCSQLNRLPFLL